MTIPINLILIPTIIALLPALIITVKFKWTIFKAKKGMAVILLSILLLLISYYNIWSLMYGPMSLEDLGPGVVYAGAIIIFQTLPLIVTIPAAFWAIRSTKI